MKTVFALKQPDGSDHGGHYTVAHFAKKDDAELIGKTGYGYRGFPRADGGNTVDWRVDEITVFDSIDEFKTHPDHAAGVTELLETTVKRMAALAKLSDEDKAVLGIKEPKHM